jgi:hypothetical protein
MSISKFHIKLQYQNLEYHKLFSSKPISNPAALGSFPGAHGLLYSHYSRGAPRELNEWDCSHYSSYSHYSRSSCSPGAPLELLIRDCSHCSFEYLVLSTWPVHAHYSTYFLRGPWFRREYSCYWLPYMRILKCQDHDAGSFK